MDGSQKRKAERSTDGPTNKKSKGPKAWRVPKKSQGGSDDTACSIETGDAGIWATCDRGLEGKATAELHDLFNEYTERTYGDRLADDAPEGKDDEAKRDIEADINNEIKDLQKPSHKPLFQSVKIEMQCVLFFKTRAPLEPVSFVHSICSEAQQGTTRNRSRCIRRLTPITMTGKATEKGLEEVAKVVLAPQFHADRISAKKFAIRTSIRNHTALTRDAVIKQVAEGVGAPHTVDLTRYDLLILVEIYKNVCGMSVVGNDFEPLKRYNLAEIHDAARTKGAAE